MKTIWYLRLFFACLLCGFSVRGAVVAVGCGGYEDYRKDGYSPTGALSEDLSYV